MNANIGVWAQIDCVNVKIINIQWETMQGKSKIMNALL